VPTQEEISTYPGPRPNLPGGMGGGGVGSRLPPEIAGRFGGGFPHHFDGGFGIAGEFDDGGHETIYLPPHDGGS
jgi:hypothetical protein